MKTYFTSQLNRAAWAIRKAAAQAMNVRVSDVSWKVCLDMARNNETFLGEVKMETISLARFERAANSKEVITAIFNATMKTGHDMTQPKAWIKGDKVRIYLAAKGARRNSDMGYLTLENGKVVMGGKSGWTHNTTQGIIAAAEAAIIANISEDDAVEVSRTVKDLGENMIITTYDAKGRIIRSYWAD